MEPDQEDRESPNESRHGLDRHLAVFVEDSALWPVLVVMVLTFVTFGAALLFLAFADRNFFAVAALLLLLWMSVDFSVRRRRSGGLGVAGVFIVVLWALSALAAFGVSRLSGF